MGPFPWSHANSVQVVLRAVLAADHAAIAAIERSQPYGHSPAELADRLRPQQRVALVACWHEVTCGWLSYDQAHHRLELLDFAVAPAYRRRGVGGQMVVKMINRLDGVRRTQLGIVVREHNVGAQLFLRNQGFRCVRTLPGHYPDSGDDGYQFLRGIHDVEPVPIVGDRVLREGRRFGSES